MKLFKGKKILITGGTGSLGEAVVEELLKHQPEVIRIYSRDESKQFEMKKKYRHAPSLRFLLGDIRDFARLRHAMKDIDIVFHMAALKHVVACEYNPFESVKTNVLGTMNVVDAALEEGVEKLVFSSTDKATNPCNTMGVSKLLAERLATAAQYYAGAHETVMCTVRFGNVLGSRGSFIPLLKRQIAQGGPITLTDPDMTRFVMSLKDSLNLMFKSMSIAMGGEVFILKMPALRIGDLVEVFVEELGPRYGYSPEDIKIDLIGPYPGEKLYEELATAEEMERAVDIGEMYVLKPQVTELIDTKYSYKGEEEAKKTIYASNKEVLLTKAEIRDLMIEAGLFE